MAKQALTQNMHNTVQDAMFKNNSCFVAGTLVWTDRGLRPIEAIQVGDLVLSKPENDDNAPTAYKRVTHTSSRVAEVMFVAAHREKQNYVENPDDPYDCPLESSGLIVTEEHPFWVNPGGSLPGWCWRPVYRLQGELRLQDGSERRNSAVHAIRPFRDQNSQPVDGLAVTSDKFNYGRIIDFRGAPDFPAMFAPGFNVDVSDIYDPDNYYSTRVFNLTVEDYHTYFVGEWGIWVHNNCPAQVLQISTPG